MMLVIDHEFADQIPPLMEEEFRQLEANILSDGVVINPIIIWNGIIVDGHNRYRVLQKHPEIPYDTFEKKFSGRNEVMAWICKNQLGRRNLSSEQRKYLIGKQYSAEKHKEPFKGNQYTFADESGCGQNVHHQKEGKVAERIAKENNTNERFVRRAERFAEGVDAAEDVVPGIRQEILSGKICPIDSVVQAVARASPEEREPLVKHLHDPEVQRRGRKRPETEEDRIVQKVADEMNAEEPLHKVSEDGMLVSLRGVAESMVRRCNRCFEIFPTLLTEQPYRKQVLEILQGPKNYIINIESGGNQ